MIGILDVGGGMKGAYTAGIYDYLLDNNIDFKYCIGVSAGSANLTSYIAEQRGRNIAFYLDYLFRKDYMGINPIIKQHSVIDLDYIYKTLSNEDGDRPVDYETLSNSDKQFVIVATDAVTGEAHYFTKKDMKRNDFSVLKASSAMPVFSRPFEVDGKLYYDGGVADPIPYEKAFADGCDKLVVLLTAPRNNKQKQQQYSRKIRKILHKYPRTVDSLETRHLRHNVAINELGKMEKSGKVLIVDPKEGYGVGTLPKDKEALMNLYQEGYDDGLRIKEFLDK